MTKTRFHEKLKTRKVSRYPGDLTLALTAPATDRDGMTYPKGTKLVPQAGGYDGPARSNYVDAMILGS